jgi:polysaccharide pyruvyl transferase WcaK-like protein
MEHLRSIHGEVGGLPLLFNKPGIDYRDVSQILSSALAYIGGRYHTAIQSAAVRTPFLAVPAESHKTQGLLQMLDYPLGIVPFDDVTGVRNGLRRILSDRDSLAGHLDSALKRIQTQRKQGIEMLSNVLR